MSKIFLSGGGNKTDSALLDKEFASRIKPKGALLYIPVAKDDSQHVKCLEWFKSVFEQLRRGEIRMLTDLNKRKGLSDIGGIYIGGGDTAKLLDEINKTNFGSYLREAQAHDIPIYGGSAGAIVLGKSIKTDSDLMNDSNQPANGLNMLAGYSVVCHYQEKDKDKITKLAQEIGPLIILSEKSGAIVEDRSVVQFGEQPVIIITNDSRATTIERGDRRPLHYQ
jgi:dipeptidase E